MGENEENIEKDNESKEIKETKNNLTFKIPPLTGILTELLRLMVYVLVGMIISYFMINQKTTSDLALNIRALDQQGNNEIIFDQVSGKEWEMEEILINTADDFANHFVKTKIIFSYNKDSTLQQLNTRQNQIYSEIRKIVGINKYADLKSIKKQEELSREIKNRVQRILKTSDTINVYLKEFTIH